jgi:hypothetical protein
MQIKSCNLYFISGGLDSGERHRSHKLPVLRKADVHVCEVVEDMRQLVFASSQQHLLKIESLLS